MGKILYGKELKDFIDEYKVDCTSIIIKINCKKKEAYYIIDGLKKISIDYMQATKYFSTI